MGGRELRLARRRVIPVAHTAAAAAAKSPSGGSGLSAFASRRATCHSWVAMRTLRKDGMPLPADSVVDLPEGFAGRVVTDADHSIALRLPQLRGLRIHVVGKRRRRGIHPVAGGALLSINYRAGLQVDGARFDGGRFGSFRIDPGVKSETRNLPFPAGRVCLPQPQRDGQNGSTT